MPRPLQSGPERIPVSQFRANLPSFLRQAKEGKSFLLTSRDEVVAEIRPPQPPAPVRRKPGALRGTTVMADDFDTWPMDILDSFEASIEEDLEG